MPTTAGKNYIKHPKTALAEVFKISTDYAHNALKTLGEDKVLDAGLREQVQKIIDEKLPEKEFKAFRKLINLHFVKGKKVEEAAKTLNISVPQTYAWLAEVKLVVADIMYLPRVLVETYKDELIELLKTDQEMIKAVSKANKLMAQKKRGPKGKGVKK